jgi:hypothetical protein
MMVMRGYRADVLCAPVAAIDYYMMGDLYMFGKCDKWSMWQNRRLRDGMCRCPLADEFQTSRKAYSR